jgi:hypothetical protein
MRGGRNGGQNRHNRDADGSVDDTISVGGHGGAPLLIQEHGAETTWEVEGSDGIMHEW